MKSERPDSAGKSQLWRPTVAMAENEPEGVFALTNTPVYTPALFCLNGPKTQRFFQCDEGVGRRDGPAEFVV